MHERLELRMRANQFIDVIKTKPVEEIILYVIRALASPDFDADKKTVGCNAIFYAVQRTEHRTEVLDVLCRLGCDPLAVDSVGQTAAFYAARDGHIDALERLFQSGADIDSIDQFGQTPVFYAAREGRTDTVRWLVAHGADLNRPDSEGDRPVTYAVREGQHETLSSMVALGAATSFKNKLGSRLTDQIRGVLDSEVQTKLNDILDASAAVQLKRRSSNRKRFRLMFYSGDAEQFVMASGRKLQEFEQRFPDVGVWASRAPVPPIRSFPVANLQDQWSKRVGRFLEMVPKEAQAFKLLRKKNKAEQLRFARLVTCPMTLTVMKMKWVAGRYRRLQDFVDDVELLIANHEVAEDIHAALDAFKHYWSEFFMDSQIQTLLEKETRLACVLGGDLSRTEQSLLLEESEGTGTPASLLGISLRPLHL